MKPQVSRIAEADRSWDIEFSCQWGEWLPWKSMNWREFCFVRCDFEADHLTGEYSARLGLLGLMVGVSKFNRLKRSAFIADMEQRAQPALDAMRRQGGVDD